MTGAAPRWHGSAFGLNLVGAFAAPGLDRGTGAAGPEPTTALARVSREELDRAWTSTDVELLYEHALPSGTFAIRRHAERGYRVEHSYFGRFHVAADGARISCAPADLPDWLWQRLLVGQLLPLASLLRGYEPLHASAVAIGGRAVVVMGPSGVGKSSVALQAVVEGASFVTDDVAALELRDGGVVVHPGPALVGVDETELARLPDRWTARWERLGSIDGEARIAVAPPAREPAPVAAVYVLGRGGTAGGLELRDPALGRLELLVGGTFNAYMRDPARLVRQLEVAGSLAETAPLREVRVPPDTGAAAVAAAIVSSFAALDAA